MSMRFDGPCVGLPVAVVTTTIRRKDSMKSVFRIDRVCDSMEKAWAVVEAVYNSFLRTVEHFEFDEFKYIVIYNNYSMIDGFDAVILEGPDKEEAWVCVNIERTRIS